VGARRLQLGRVGTPPEIEYVIVDGARTRQLEGISGMAEAWRDVLDTWEGWRGEVDERRELDDERVLVLSHFSGRGKTSGMELGQLESKGASARDHGMATLSSML
jgi:hypothetical protein